MSSSTFSKEQYCSIDYAVCTREYVSGCVHVVSIVSSEFPFSNVAAGLHELTVLLTLFNRPHMYD